MLFRNIILTIEGDTANSLLNYGALGIFVIILISGIYFFAKYHTKVIDAKDKALQEANTIIHNEAHKNAERMIALVERTITYSKEIEASFMRVGDNLESMMKNIDESVKRISYGKH